MTTKHNCCFPPRVTVKALKKSRACLSPIQVWLHQLNQPDKVFILFSITTQAKISAQKVGIYHKPCNTFINKYIFSPLKTYQDTKIPRWKSCHQWKKARYYFHCTKIWSMHRINLAFVMCLFKSMSTYFPSLWIFPRIIANLDSFIPSCLKKLRKLSAGRSKLTVTLCKRIGDSKKTKEQLKLSAKPFKNCRCVPQWHVFIYVFLSHYKQTYSW